MPNSTCSETLELFGERVRLAREAKGLSQRLLAGRIALDYTFISHVEAGRRALSYDPLIRVADALEVSVDYLLGRTSRSTG